MTSHTSIAPASRLNRLLRGSFWRARFRTAAVAPNSMTIAKATHERHAHVASTHASKKTLADLRTGETASIRSITGSSASRLHLMEMGLTPGTQVKVIRLAVFGGPLDISVRGYRLSLRRSEAATIELHGVH